MFPPISFNAIYRPPMIRDWQELVHPLGGTYYYNNRKNAYTSMNIGHYQDLQRLDDFINASRSAAKEDGWVLVVYPAIFMGEQRFQYYYVVPDHQIITWLEDMDGHILFGECVNPSKWRHKRLELEAQYWRVADLLCRLIKMNSLDCRSPLHRKHFEFFPHNFRMNTSQVRRIRREMGCYLGEATTLSQSTAASMFWTLDQMNKVVDQLASIEDLADNDSIEETGVVFCCRILYILRHYQYLNRHNQPEARLIRKHAVKERPRNNRLFSFIGNAAAMVLCVPVTIERIQTTSVDGIVNGVEVRRFVNDFSSQAKSQITLAGVSMALDVAILAIPGLGTSAIAQTLCSCSLLLGVGCIFAGNMVQHFGERMGSLDFAAYYLRKKKMMLIIITSIPTFFCVLSVIGSILGFLSGVITDLSPSAPIIIACIVTLCIVACLLVVLVIASYGPSLARMRPQ
ncbi:uncharacterized protein HD556DRAFT_1451275 [Suillus plorans]|uniref:Uncharacterized protein n=1 Tax=Suillus plorans TaxID=116603 RepID=A0A9P7DAD8_9AGAM|nr:uncharacterized protein HD556DRAFT_1451275 [Suillus plorans]KAG1784892.1 hypothetical protein HD556DRAFT_1451275 [Suillus plorans]